MQDYPELDEGRWRAWVQKGRRHDKVVLARQRVVLGLFCLVAASVVVYLFATPR